MRIRSWFVRAVLFLALLPSLAPGAPPPNGGSEARGTASTGQPLEEIRRDTRKTFQEVEALLARRRDQVERETAKALSPALRQSLAAWELDTSGRVELRNNISAELARQHQGAQLDLLLVITQKGELFSSEDGAAKKGSERKTLLGTTLLAVMGPFFQDGRSATSVEAFSATGENAGEAPDSMDASPPELFFTAVLPVPLRPEAPRSLLVGLLSIRALEGEIGSVLDRSVAKLRWHLFLKANGEEASVISGSAAGSRLRGSLVKDLAARAVSEEQAFEGDSEQLGRWAVLQGHGGKFVGGWGLSADPLFLEAALNARPEVKNGAVKRAELGAPAHPEDAKAPAYAEPASFADIVAYCVGATLAAGIVWVLLAALIGANRRRAAARRLALSAVSPSKGAFPRAPEPVADSIMAQFEINWKTFASYTQDLLHQKLKELEEAPQKGIKEVARRVDQLFEASGKLGGELAAAREEIKSSSGALAEKVGNLLAAGNTGKPGLSAQAEDMLARIDAEFLRTREGFSQLERVVARLAEVFGERQNETVAQRVVDETARIRGELEEHTVGLASELAAAREERERLEAELAETHRAQAALREDLERAAEREEALLSQVDEEKSRVELTAQEREAARQREREVIAELHDVERREEDACRRLREVEEVMKEQESSLAEGRGKEEELLREIHDVKASEEKYREAIKEIYREEGRFQQDLERKEKEFEKERASLQEKLDQLEAEKAALQALENRKGVELDRLNEFCAARQKELEALGRAFLALKEEKQHFELEARRFQEEVQSQRDAYRRLEESRHRATHEEVTRLEGSLRERELGLARKDEELAVQRQEVARLQETLGRTRLEADSLNGEIEALRKELSVLQSTGGAAGEKLAAEKDELRKALEVSRSEASRQGQLVRESEKQLRLVEEERLHFKARFTELEARWHSRQAELELKIADAERQRDDANRKLAEAEDSTRQFAAQLETGRSAARVEKETLKSIAALEAEKSELARNMERLTGEMDKVRAEAEEIRRFHGTLVDGSLPAAIVAVDADLKVFSWNARAAALWGKTAPEVAGRGLAALGLKGIDAEVVQCVRHVIQTGSRTSLPQVAFSDSEAKAKHIRLSCDPITGPQGEGLGAVIIAEDISETMEKEIEARVQSLFAESLVRSLPAALVLVDGRNRVISWNHNAAEIFGLREDSVLGQDLFSLRTPLAKDVFKRRFEENKKKRAPSRVRVRLESRGVPQSFLVTQSPFWGEGDSVRGTMLLIQEVVTAVESAT